MKKVFYVLLAMLMVLGLSVAQAEERVTVMENNNHQSYRLHVGEQLDILLRYNAGTAFVWTLGGPNCENSPSLRIEQENGIAIGPSMPGSPYFAHFIVSALMPGKGCVELVMRNYSNHGAPFKFFKIQVEVVE